MLILKAANCCVQLLYYIYRLGCNIIFVARHKWPLPSLLQYTFSTRFDNNKKRSSSLKILQIRFFSQPSLKKTIQYAYIQRFIIYILNCFKHLTFIITFTSNFSHSIISQSSFEDRIVPHPRSLIKVLYTQKFHLYLLASLFFALKWFHNHILVSTHIFYIKLSHTPVLQIKLLDYISFGFTTKTALYIFHHSDFSMNYFISKYY